MAKKEDVDRLKQGGRQWNAWRKNSTEVPDLREADLSAANLRGANLSQANLFAADLIKANLSQADLSEANLRETNLSQANLREADLSEADLSEVWVGWTVLGDVDLSVAKGLDTQRHLGPSTIGIDTLYKSSGKIPDVFLRGAGVPDSLIVYVGALVGKPIEFYSCFISYSHPDKSFARRLNLNVYTQTSLESRIQAVETLESAFVN